MSNRNTRPVPLKTFVVDSFTAQPFQGNPAGVCLSPESIAETRMQNIASELNLSETAFVVNGTSPDQFWIRYFSPKMEIPLCGHATLAAAKVLAETNQLDRIRFTTGAQLELNVQVVGDRIEMKFPVYELQAATAPDALMNALGIQQTHYCGYNAENRILMLEIADARELAQLQPDFNALIQSHTSINGVLVTAVGDDEFDFHSRYFWPWSGTNEDPVTGGTHTFLAKYWSDRLGKKCLQSFQSSSRTGQMEVEISDRNELFIRGQAIIVLDGEIRV